MPKKTKYAEDKEDKLKSVLGRIEKHTNNTSPSNKNSGNTGWRTGRPVISGISPDAGAIDSSVTITGTGFGPVQQISCSIMQG
jgi:hypothetical protein